MYTTNVQAHQHVSYYGKIPTHCIVCLMGTAPDKQINMHNHQNTLRITTVMSYRINVDHMQGFIIGTCKEG